MVNAYWCTSTTVLLFLHYPPFHWISLYSLRSIFFLSSMRFIQLQSIFDSLASNTKYCLKIEDLLDITMTIICKYGFDLITYCWKYAIEMETYIDWHTLVWTMYVCVSKGDKHFDQKGDRAIFIILTQNLNHCTNISLFS